jgi:hypothetical protein
MILIGLLTETSEKLLSPLKSALPIFLEAFISMAISTPQSPK